MRLSRRRMHLVVNGYDASFSVLPWRFFSGQPQAAPNLWVHAEESCDLSRAWLQTSGNGSLPSPPPPPPKSRTPTCVILWAFRGCIHSSFFKCKMSLWGCSLSTLSEFRPFMRQKTLLQLVFKNLVCLILVQNSAPKLLSRPVSIWVVKLQQPTWVKTSEQEKFLPVSSRSFTHLNDQFKCTRASVRVAKFSGFVEYCHWKEHSPKPAAVLHVWLNFNVYASSSQKY